MIDKALETYNVLTSQRFTLSELYVLAAQSKTIISKKEQCPSTLQTES